MLPLEPRAYSERLAALGRLERRGLVQPAPELLALAALLEFLGRLRLAFYGSSVRRLMKKTRCRAEGPGAALKPKADAIAII